VDRPFVHLHCHSHYSLLDGASRIPELVRHVKQLGMNAVALTDHGNLYGAIELYREATAVGVKPIIGYEAYVAPGHRADRDTKGISEASYHLTLLAENQTGFRNLIKLASLAFLEGFYYRPRIDKELLEKYHEGIICLSGCASSEFSTLILKNQMDEAARLARWYADVFGRNNFFIEIQNNGLDIQQKCAEGAIAIAQQLGMPLVATCDAHYLCQRDAAAHDVLLCINTGKLRSDLNRLRYGNDQFYVRAPAELYAQFPDHPDAVRRSQEIADRCTLELDFKTRHFPVFTPPDGKTAEAYLRELCEQGLRERYGPEPSQAARDRLEHELAIICRLGFAGYFLIVWDFVRFARERGIPASARGSACGALVSYVLHLSHVDPLAYDLLFERFLDPNRAEAPDIDIDFCQERREEVLQYVRQKYGEESVAQIATFGTLAARAAIKDVGRVLGLELSRVDQLSKMVPQQIGITLERALQLNPDLRREYDHDPQVRELIDIARELEGTNRNIGTHAAGVVIANGPLTDYVPVQRVAAKGSSGEAAGRRSSEPGTDDPEAGGGRTRGALSREGTITTQWTMEDLEKVGMLKMDFLGLRNLTLLDRAVKLIRQTRGVTIDLNRLPLDDAETFALFQRGDTQGVFQFESEGIRNLLQRMKPDNIHDIIAANALYRPGPLGGGMVDAYINRKHGREQPVYQHPVMEEILAETYGVMCYQEQVMRILNRLGGIELSSAYACIKAISKKKHDVIAKRREEFIAGAEARGVAVRVAAEIFDLITFFGGYGFNRSHSAAYAHVAYQTAYLKAHYPAEFMAAVLTSEIGNTDKIAEHIENTRRAGLDVLPPDINQSDVDFTVRDNQVVFGLAAIRGLGRKAAEAIVAERQARGPYKDLFELCERLDAAVVTRAALETLIKAGALDGFGAKRAALMAVLPAALEAGREIQEDRRHGQRHIFEGFAEEEKSAAAGRGARMIPDLKEWSDTDRLSYEKEALGFYISSHPLARYEGLLQRFASHTVSQIGTVGANQEVILGGMLVGVRFTNAKRSRSGHTRMARFKLEDLTGTAECILFPDDFLKNKDHIREEYICFVKATVDRTREEPGLIVSKILPLDQAERELTRGLRLRVISGIHTVDHVRRLGELLQRARGRCPVFLDVVDGGGRRARLRLGEEFFIDASKIAKTELEHLLGPEHVEFWGTGNGNGNGRNGH
jgi:DNA polymerase-3 subunit alpha